MEETTNAIEFHLNCLHGHNEHKTTPLVRSFARRTSHRTAVKVGENLRVASRKILVEEVEVMAAVERGGISSTSSSASASNSSSANSATGGGFIPPVARRKLATRKMTRQRERRNQAIYAVIVLLSTFSFVVINLNYWKKSAATRLGTFDQNGVAGHVRGGGGGGGGAATLPFISPDAQPFNQNNVAKSAKNLIVVAGHSVTVSGHLLDAGSDENDWFLLSYQKGQGLPQAILRHIETGIEEANRDKEALLVFSGGETRAVTGPTTEGHAYFLVADAMNLWPTGGTVRARATAEEFATDSFENLLFSIARFREVTGDYPQTITVVSFTFKQRRFETLHAHALRWPPDRFSYVGVDPPASTGFDLQRATNGELENAAKPFEQDPYGCHSELLQQKRKDRNPFSRTAPYPLSAPEMKELLGYCGPQLFPDDRVPWGKNK
mmetsp:Transcript_10210/g.24535  ORF Transcript_10210/g.24535 Transcript_10210/m.24535 type:complete len:437 (+) Transcript_10210:12-1322(+)